MRSALLLILLGSVIRSLCASEPGSAPTWKDGQLVKVVANGFSENEKPRVIGHPMFQKLTVQPEIPSESGRKIGTAERWLISGTVVDTNAGFKQQEVPIYIGRDDGLPMLRAMSNRLGEVSFYVYPTRFVEAGMDMMPNRIYVGQIAFGQSPPRDSFVRRYRLRPTDSVGTGLSAPAYREDVAGDR